jgi:hypothetical protein
MTADMILALEGQHFRRYYLLYIVEISHDNDKHYYIGQTGDNNATTARPAFRRLAGHLADSGKSTENQIYRYLAEKVLKIAEAGIKDHTFSKKTKQTVEDYLVHSTIRMHVYTLQVFPPDIDHEVHKENVRMVRLFEKFVIDLFVKNHKKIGNKILAKPPKGEEGPYPDILKRIKNDFQLI